MPTFLVKDLTREVPRSPFETLDGIPWLARLIDKVRAMNAGKLGEYTPYPCGGDRHFLATLDLDAEALKTQISGGHTDSEILAWVKSQLPADVDVRLATYREQARTPVTGEMAEYLEGAKQALVQARPGLDVSQVKTFGALICVEEGHPLPQ